MAEPSASGVSGASPSRRPSKAPAFPPPPGNTGTHWTGPNEYLLAQLTRANYITARRHPFAATSDAFCAALQRLVHYEGNRPPNRKILLHLRLLTYYPPNPSILSELFTLLESENVHVCRLAHYHVRQNAPIRDPQLYRDLVEALEREVLRPSPARRAAATKTLAKVFLSSDVSRASDFVMDVFNCIGGARVKAPDQPAPRKIAGIEVPGTDKNKKKNDKRAKGQSGTSFLSKNVVASESYDATPGQREQEEKERRRQEIDDGTGGVMQSVRGNAEFIKSKFGKMLVGHTVFAAMRRINRVATHKAKVESYLFDSGFMSIVPSTVRHCIALLELRSTVSPGPVSRFLAPRLPHKNPPASKRLHLEELGARVYFARLLSALAEDPNLSAFIPDEAPKQAKRDANSNNPTTIKTALAASTYKEKASNLFKFLFNKERVSQVVGAVKSTTSTAISGTRAPRLKRDDPLGVEFAEALVNLLKNASNRVLIEALRGLSRRRWTTWFEAPIPQGALYNSPELQDAEAYGGTADAWGLNEDGDDDDDEDNENELGAYEDDVVGDDPEGSKGSLRSAAEVPDPALDDLNIAGEKETWFSRLKLQRKERRDARINEHTPFYLRKVGQGMVPALEVILRRISGALLHDEPVRRFSATDAIIVLARAKIYGHTSEDHQRLRKAQSSVQSAIQGSSSRALVTVQSAGPLITAGGSAFSEEKHPFQALVRPLAELVEEDPNQFVRGRAAVALLFVLTSGAGRDVAYDSDVSVSEEALARNSKLQKVPLLLRYFRSFVTHETAGSGIGLRLLSEVIDYLVYEVLDVAPELAPSAVEMAELWAMTHPTVGVCGRLGALWEKVLSLGQGDVVGRSIFRAVACKPREERVASAAIIFLRRRTLDLAIITVGSSQVPGIALPEPLPRAVGVEMERYFSLLWHAALLGPSAECRTFAVEALGGAAALAGEPFRCCAYERLVELVRMRGFGLKIPAEQVLNSLDVLYFSRERFSEARAKNRIARDGSNKSKKWLELVWRLAAESASAAQILLGVPPPTGWQPLGPSAATDLANAEGRFGDVRDRQDNMKLKDTSVALSSAPDEAPLLAIEPDGANSGVSGSPRKVGSGGVGDVPPNASLLAYSSRHLGDERSRRRSRSPERYLLHEEYGNQRGSAQGEYADDIDDYERREYGTAGHYDRRRRRSRSASPRNFRLPRSRSDLQRDDSYNDGETHHSRFQRRTSSERQGAHTADIGRESRKEQEQADFELARRLQEAEGDQSSGFDGDGDTEQGTARVTLGGASDVAGKLLSKGLRGGKTLTDKAIRAAAKSGAMDKLRGAGNSSRRD